MKILGISDSNSYLINNRGLKSIKLPQRFLKDKIAHSGEDPKGSIIEFIKHDIIKPLDRQVSKKEENSHHKNPSIISFNEKWALNSTKLCTSPEMLPKVQQFKEYNFVKYDPIKADHYKKNYIKTDHISLKVPKDEIKQNGRSFIESKGNLIIYEIIIYYMPN